MYAGNGACKARTKVMRKTRAQQDTFHPMMNGRTGNHPAKNSRPTQGIMTTICKLPPHPQYSAYPCLGRFNSSLFPRRHTFSHLRLSGDSWTCLRAHSWIVSSCDRARRCSFSVPHRPMQAFDPDSVADVERHLPQHLRLPIAHSDLWN